MKNIFQYTYNLTLLYALLFSVTVIFAQPINKLTENVMMPTPNAAALGKYSDIPVSYYTGVPNIGIPIHTLKEGSLSLPISLSYHASGVKVGEPASWVGLGWSLNAGGMIARTIQGRADEDGVGYLNEGADLELDVCETGQDVEAIADGQKDGEPDIFTFNVGGYTGKFYLNSQGDAVLIPLQDVQIEYTLDGSGTDRLKQFKITTPEGIKYYFGTTSEDGFNAIEMTRNPNFTAYPSTWYLRKIESSDGKFKIMLHYVAEQYSYSYRLQQNNIQGSGGILAGYYSQMYTDGVRLSSITTSTTTVSFLVDPIVNREDLASFSGNYAKSLKTIQIQTGSGTYCKQFDLTQDYFEDNSSFKQTLSLYLASNKRLRLTQVKERSCNSTILNVPAYTFEYYSAPSGGSNFLPNRLTKAIDHWGFYNGADINNNIPNGNFNVPPIDEDFHFQGFGGALINAALPFILSGEATNNPNGTVDYHLDYNGQADRDPSEAHMKAGTLKKINYPTGGHHEFVYEANQYYGEIEDQGDVLVSLADDCFNTNEQTGSTWQTFTSNEINQASCQISLSNISQGSGSNCAAPAKITVNLYASYNFTTTVASISLNTNSTLLYPSAGTLLLKDLFSTYNFQTGTYYNFGIFVEGGEGSFKLYGVPTIYNGNVVAGGLRIQKITAYDGITTNNDVIKTYDYTEPGSSTQSSGILYNKPLYGHVLAQNTIDPGDPCDEANAYLDGEITFFHFIFENSIVPLSSFEGYHLGYGYVTENFEGNSSDPTANGSREMEYYTEHSPYFEYVDDDYDLYDSNPGQLQYPIAPTKARIEAGNLYKETVKNQSGVPIYEKTNIKRPINDDSYIVGTDQILKAAELNYGGYPWTVYNSYQIRTKPYRLEQTIETIDGVTTTKNFEYNNDYDDLLFPIEESVINSDGKVHKTKFFYSDTYPSTNLKDKLLEKNMLLPAYKTEKWIGSDMVDGTQTEYKFFSTTGYSTTSITDLIYPYRIKRFECTWVNGILQCDNINNWTIQRTFSKYSPTYGLPEQTNKAGWSTEYLFWHTDGQLKKWQFSGYIKEYDFYPQTGLIQSAEAVDGTSVSFTYDALMRVKTTTDDCRNVVTTYDYEYGTPGATGLTGNYFKSTIDYPLASNSSLDILENYVYVDGLGREIASVGKKQGSNFLYDVLVATEYDNQGRVKRKYEPKELYANNGGYQTPSTSWDHTLYEYQQNPLNRLKKESFSASDINTKEYEYGSNNVLDGVVNYSGSGNYAANLLSKATITDFEENEIATTYTDKIGRNILTKRVNQKTYTLYDDKGRVTKVLPPGTTNSSTYDDLVYEYEYYKDDLLKTKKIPDQEYIEYRYNTKDLMAMYQDGELRNDSKWYAYQFDTYGRETVSGFCTTVYTNGTFSNPSITTTNQQSKKQYGTGVEIDKIIKDEYKILGSGTWLTSNLNYDACGRLLDVSKNNHLNASTTSESIDYEYDWADNLTKETRSINVYGNTHTFTQTHDIDDIGRLRREFFKVNTGSDTEIGSYTYTHKGQLAYKFVGKVGNDYLQQINYAYRPNGLLQKINAHNLANSTQTLEICTPNPNPANPSSSDYNGKDLFYLELYYENNMPTGLTNTAEYNGNISGMRWQVKGRKEQVYTFNYDTYDRLTNADYYDQTSSGSYTASGKFDVDISYADERGNIQSLDREGMYNAGGTCWLKTNIDDLSYTYYPNSNRIKQITDNGATGHKLRGFTDTNNTIDYYYDSNGNMTYDPDKALNITYNHLNLPTKFDFGSNNRIEVLYDAAGSKLQQKVYQNNVLTSTKDYVGGVEYQDGTIEATYHAEGRAFFYVNDAQVLTHRHEYAIKDHLGNIRLWVSDLDNDGILETPSEILQEKHNYPFGMAMEGPWMQSGANNPYQYNGKELVEDLGLDLMDYGARWYDAAVGRWWSVDPLADHPNLIHYSSYVYTVNNPILHTDPDGKCPPWVCGAIVGGGTEYAIQVVENVSEQGVTWSALKPRSPAKIVNSTIIGAATGGFSAVEKVRKATTTVSNIAVNSSAGVLESVTGEFIEIVESEEKDLTDMKSGGKVLKDGVISGLTNGLFNQKAKKAVNDLFESVGGKEVSESLSKNIEKTVETVEKGIDFTTDMIENTMQKFIDW